MRARDLSWVVWNATVCVPTHLKPAHKARSETVVISVAVPEREAAGSLYIGFKTRVSATLPFSLDAQFDPSTAREAVIQNPWNEWLIDRCADLLSDIAVGLLLQEPAAAWKLIPLGREYVGDKADGWLQSRFVSAFRRVRDEVGATGALSFGQEQVPLSRLGYDDETVAGLLDAPDIEALVPGARALPSSVRDDDGRWREVLEELQVATKVGTAGLLEGFARGLFGRKEKGWWVEAAVRLTTCHVGEGELFGVPFWLTDDGQPVCCRRPSETASPLVLADSMPGFSSRWKLLERVNDAYLLSSSGNRAIEWLAENAAFTFDVGAETELAAFAERFAEQPVAITDEDLREIRDRFDELSDRRAAEIGQRVGAALLLDGFVYKGGKPQRQKVSPTRAYLSRTLDSDNPNWPTAAGTTPDIEWVAARYDEQLKTGATRTSRRRADGTISRGPRKFLMLLGIECTPRLVKTNTVQWGGPTRISELRSAGAEEVIHDFRSPDLTRVLVGLGELPNKDVKIRSPALLRALSRNWERVYAGHKKVPSRHHARVYMYEKEPVTAEWLIGLREEPWIAVGRGQLVPPASAVIKSLKTQTLYPASMFAIGVEPDDLDGDFAFTLGLITDVRLSHLLNHLAGLRDSSAPVDEAHILQIYQTIAKMCPKSVNWQTLVGDLSVQTLRAKFSDGAGLIYGSDGVWRRPGDLLLGKDIFHDRSRFVPGGPACARLWSALNIREPTVDDCISFCRALSRKSYDPAMTAPLIDVLRYLQPLLRSAERTQKNRLKNLPLVCFGKWQVERPIYLVEDLELRNELARIFPGQRFWTPPCDVRDLREFIDLARVTRIMPALKVVDDKVRAQDLGEAMRVRFRQTVEHLSDELARNDPITREKIDIGWDPLTTIPLYVYDRPFAVEAVEVELSSQPIRIARRALMTRRPHELHICVDALPQREHGGRAIASLFPTDVGRRIDGEWALSWTASMETATTGIRLASDESLNEALEEQAGKINAATKLKIKVSTPASRSPGAVLRTLKELVGAIAGAKVDPGSPSKSADGGVARRRPLSPRAPEPSRPAGAQESSFVAYTNADLEQRAWEILEQVLNTSEDERLVDFRKRHGVGADGAIDWKTFVELKATGRGPLSSIEMSNAQYERAKERGKAYILALVSGLETNQRDEVRLIIDPANCVPTQPVNGIRLTGLLECQAVVIHFDSGVPENGE